MPYGFFGQMSGQNSFNQDTNPLLNIASIPTGPTFNGNDVGHAFRRMAHETPHESQRVIGGLPTMTGPRNPHLGAINRNVAQIGQGQFGQNKISLLRNPVTTGGPQLQQSAQTAAAEQMRDLEQLSNVYLQNAFTQQNQRTNNLSMILRMLGM